jgi:purine-binding chemotaxis protein CheW
VNVDRGNAAHCTFRVGELWFGVDVHAVQEVIPLQAMTSVPQAGNGLWGLISLRGRVVPTVDMGRQLDLTERRPGVDAMIIVVDSDDGPVGLVVEEVGEVVDVDAGARTLCPDSVSDHIANLIDLTYQLPDRLLFVLEMERTISSNRAERESA